MSVDPAQEKRLERNSSIAAAVLVLTPVLLLDGFLFGWGDALHLLAFSAVLIAIAVCVWLLRARLPLILCAALYIALAAPLVAIAFGWEQVLILAIGTVFAVILGRSTKGTDRRTEQGR